MNLEWVDAYILCLSWRSNENPTLQHPTFIKFERVSGPLHTRDWVPVTITLQALSLVETAEPVQVHFILRSRDQWSMWMRDGCKVYVDSYMASNGSRFMVTWTILKNHLLDVGLRASLVVRVWLPPSATSGSRSLWSGPTPSVCLPSLCGSRQKTSRSRQIFLLCREQKPSC